MLSARAARLPVDKKTMPTSTRAEVRHDGSGRKVRAGHTAVQGQAHAAIHFRVPFARRLMNSEDSRMSRLRLFMFCFSFLRGKDSARRAKCKRKAERFSFCISEPPPILSKDSARRAKCKRKAESFSFCTSEPPPILSKDSARRAKCKRKAESFSFCISGYSGKFG